MSGFFFNLRKLNMKSYCSIGMDGAKRYFSVDKHMFHRENGPAVEYVNGDEIWWNNGVLHRVDGPAVNLANFKQEWWINGERLSPEKEAILNAWWNNKNGI